MSIWIHISKLVGRLAQEGFELVERLSDAMSKLRSNRRAVAFTVALIALSAKMAKADGVVTCDEVMAFQALCDVPAEEEANVRRLFNLAQQDVAGFDVYATKLAKLMDHDSAILQDVMDGLFSIAKADGIVHQNEINFLHVVANCFAFSEQDFDKMLNRHVRLHGQNPYAVLGLDLNATLAEVKAARKLLLQEHHPDRMIARGVPPEFLAIANERMAAINAAYDEIMKENAA